MSKLENFSSVGEEVERARLTSFGGLLQVTVNTHTGETENCGLNHFDNWYRYGLDCKVRCRKEKKQVSQLESSAQLVSMQRGAMQWRERAEARLTGYQLNSPASVRSMKRGKGHAVKRMERKEMERMGESSTY